jgi:intracellular sulfur oxidation DsrE/DsrF family protein
MTKEMRARRSMISGLGAAAVGVALGSRSAAAQTGGGTGRFQPARHQQDAWFDSIAGKHRIFIDAATPRGAGEALLYANNLYNANKGGYSLNDSDIVIVACMRHFATPFAYTDAIWKKYGKVFSMMIEFTDPKTKQVPSTNLLFSKDYGMSLPNLGTTIDEVVKRGTRFAVCDFATHFFAGQIAMATKGNADAIYKELAASLIPNARLVPAGVVAVNRAQEYGYTVQTTL